MDGRELVRETRLRLRDTENPRLWTDATLLLSLNEAQREFARYTLCLLDWDSYTLTTAADTALYTLNSDVLVLLLLQGDGDPRPLRRTTTGLRHSFSTTDGLPRHYAVVSATPMRVVLYPTPDLVKTYKMVVARLPKTDITYDSSPEIASQYHMALVDGAARLALSHSDTDGFAPEQLQIASDNWGIALRDAKREARFATEGINAVATPHPSMM